MSSHHSFQNRVFRQPYYCVGELVIDLLKGHVKLVLVNNNQQYLADGVIFFTDVTDISANGSYENYRDKCLSHLIGICDETLLDGKVNYTIQTDELELCFKTKSVPQVKWVNESIATDLSGKSNEKLKV